MLFLLKIILVHIDNDDVSIENQSYWCILTNDAVLLKTKQVHTDNNAVSIENHTGKNDNYAVSIENHTGAY